MASDEKVTRCERCGDDLVADENRICAPCWLGERSSHPPLRAGGAALSGDVVGDESRSDHARATAPPATHTTEPTDG